MRNDGAVYSLSISARAVLDMHSLNNEGGEGNQITTRMVNVVYREPASGAVRMATVNAISGDMLKHIQAEHFYLLAKGSNGELPLCAGCRVFSASRALDDAEFRDSVSGRSDREVIDALLERCALDDVAGNLIARGARSIPRKSVAEFGWVIGLPGLTTTDSYFHVRYAAERGEGQVDQPIFHRPASSGVYAIVAHFETARIGYNDISQLYAIDDEARLARYRALLESVLYTFVEPNGAMRGTQHPHVAEFSGVLTISRAIVPAPVLSPLHEDYRSQLERVAGALNELKPGSVALYPFDSLGAFAELLGRIARETRPYVLST